MQQEGSTHGDEGAVYCRHAASGFWIVLKSERRFVSDNQSSGNVGGVFCRNSCLDEMMGIP